MIPPDVEARAQAKAERDRGHPPYGAVEWWAFKYGYLAGYTDERPRIELAVLEEMVGAICPYCGRGERPDFNGRHRVTRVAGVHEGKSTDGPLGIGFRDRFYVCHASALHARIAQLRGEIEKGESA